MDNLLQAIQISLAVALLTFLILISVGLFTLRWRKHRNLPRPEKMDHLWRYLAGRAGVAAGLGLALFAVMFAFLALNTYRPQTDTNPSIRIKGPAGRTTVRYSVEHCWSPARIQLRVDPPRGAANGVRTASRAELYTDQSGAREIKIGRNGIGNFEIDDPSSRRGLLSCYISLPTVAGSRGPVRIELAMDNFMDVETTESIPAPTGYRNDNWRWDCPAGEKCPALATVGVAFEEGTKQVIVLAIASMLGAIVAIILGDAVLRPIRRRLNRGRGDADREPPPPAD